MTGCRYTIVIVTVIFFVGSVLMSLSLNFAMLLSDRCVTDISVGYVLMIAPVYSALISSTSSHSLFSSPPEEICINLGIFNITLPTSILHCHDARVTAVAGDAGPHHGCAQHPSPRQQHEEEVERRMEEIKAVVGINRACAADVVEVKSKSHGEGVWGEILRPTPAVRRVLMPTVGIHVFQHATEIEAVVLYNPRIFKKARLVTMDQLFLATITVGALKMAFVLLAVMLVDRVHYIKNHD
ncbi:putative polyol transporter 6 [Curcuma longa]|uniref:putative polyol transporter 6 n=1 Tax=Curcuma longa TaxID=136217 RepID=UPI003D9F9C81